MRRGTPWTGCQSIAGYNCTRPFTHYTDNLEMPISYNACVGRVRGVPGGSPRGTGRACRVHAHGVEAEIEPSTLEV